MKMLGQILKKLIDVDLKLYEAPAMPSFGKLDEYKPATKKEIERIERRLK